MGRSYETPAQAKLNKEIDALNALLISKRQEREAEWSDVPQAEIDAIQQKIELKKNLLKRRKNDANAQKSKRVKLKETIQIISEKDEESGNLLKTFNRKVKGRPRLEVDQPGILSTIIDIVDLNSAADDRRRSEMLRTCVTLDDLNTELAHRNIRISRSATYLRLIPNRCNTAEGLRHVETVPVKLLRPENSLR
jgi:hypothetical protein